MKSKESKEAIYQWLWTSSGWLRTIWHDSVAHSMLITIKDLCWLSQFLQVTYSKVVWQNWSKIAHTVF